MKPEDRDFDQPGRYWLVPSRKAVCKRCHAVMRDYEDMSRHGEFYHPKIDKNGKPYKCINAGKSFDVLSFEIEPFQRKRERRKDKRFRKVIKFK